MKLPVGARQAVPNQCASDTADFFAVSANMNGSVELPVTMGEGTVESAACSSTKLAPDVGMLGRDPAQAQQAMLAMGLADAAMLLLPALLLGILPSRLDAEEACDWTPRSVTLCSFLAAGCLWFSLLVLAAQAFAMASPDAHQRATLMRYFDWHLLLPSMGLLAGGSLGIVGLWGYMTLAKGSCNSAAEVLPSGTVVAGYVVAAMYCFSSIFWRGPQLEYAKPCKPQIVAGHNHAHGANYTSNMANASPDCSESPLSRSMEDLNGESPIGSLYREGAGKGSNILQTVSEDGSTIAAFAQPSGSGGRVPFEDADAAKGIPTFTPTSKWTSGQNDSCATNQSCTDNFSVVSIVRSRLPEEEHRTGSKSSRSSKGSKGSRGSKGSSGCRPNDNYEDNGQASVDAGESATDSDASQEDNYVSIFRDCKPTPTLEAVDDPNKAVNDKLATAFSERRQSLSHLMQEDRRDSNLSEVHGLPQLSPNRSSVVGRSSLKTGPSTKTRDSRVSFMGGSQSEQVREIPAENRRSYMLDKPVVLMKSNPINFDNLKGQNAKGQDSNSGSEKSDDSGDSSEEVWNGQDPTAQIEVPIWLMEKLNLDKSTNLVVEDVDEASKAKSKVENGADSKTKNQAKSKPQAASPSQEEGGANEKAVSTQREVKKPAFRRQYSCPAFESTGEESGGSWASPGKSGKSESVSKAPVNTFWKIPMPTRCTTRRNSELRRMLASEDEESDGEGDLSNQVAAEPERDSAELPSPRRNLLARSNTMPSINVSTCPTLPEHIEESSDAAANDANTPCDASSAADHRVLEGRPTNPEPPLSPQPEPRPDRLSLTEGSQGEKKDLTRERRKTTSSLLEVSPVVKGRRSRRPSALGLFSEGNVSKDGLYALPKEHVPPPMDQTRRRRKSVPAKSEIVEVRKRSLVMSASLMEGILKSKTTAAGLEVDMNEDEYNDDDEIILPLFCPLAGAEPKRCGCTVDKLTGEVIHTCMTPMSTNATNTMADVSWVCSAWSSRLNTQAAGSRRGSDTSDGLGQLPQLSQKAAGTAPKGKRIRNASVLKAVGNDAPNPNNTGGGASKANEEEEEEQARENELAVSFSAIQQTRLHSQRGSHDSNMQDPSGSSNEGPGGKNGGAGPGGEEVVESQIGHRFELVEPETLGRLLLSEEVGLLEQTLVVDVRGRDWVGGHIPSSINLRTSEVVGKPWSLLAQCRSNRIQHVIFTCMYSVLRARKCAIAFEQAQAEEQSAGMSAPYKIRTSLLRGGMHAWINHFADQFVNNSSDLSSTSTSKKLIGDFDLGMWSDGGPSQGGLVHVMDAVWSSGGQKALSDALTAELVSLQAMEIFSRRSSGQEANSAPPPPKAEPSDGQQQTTQESPLGERTVSAEPVRDSPPDGADLTKGNETTLSNLEPAAGNEVSHRATLL